MKIIYGTFWEGQDFDLVARVVDPTGLVLVPGDVASYSVDIYDLTADPRGEAPIYESTSSTSSEVLFATLQTGGRWTSDALGYNFLYRLKLDTIAPATLEGSHIYRIEVWLESSASPPSGDNTGAIPVIAEIKVSPSLKK